MTDPAEIHTRAEHPDVQPVRLHYLDWLRVLAILGIFLFHAVRRFDDLIAWNIENTEASALLTSFAGFFIALRDALLVLDGRGDQLILAAAAHAGKMVLVTSA